MTNFSEGLFNENIEVFFQQYSLEMSSGQMLEESVAHKRHEARVYLPSYTAFDEIKHIVIHTYTWHSSCNVYTNTQK